MYATAQDMIDRYGQPRMVQLTDVGAPMTGLVNNTVLLARLGDASAEIDGYLAGRMALPLAEPPAILKLMCCRIAYALLLGQRITEPEAKDLEAARAYLRDVARGTTNLLPPAAAPEVAGVGTVLFEPGTKTSWRDV